MKLKYRSVVQRGLAMGGTNRTYSSSNSWYLYISRHRNMFVTEESFLRSLVQLYGKRIVYSDGGTWYPEACAALGHKHRLHSMIQKNLIERTIEYVKDRTEDFDDYYPYMKKECGLLHIYQWMTLFMFMYNAVT